MGEVACLLKNLEAVSLQSEMDAPGENVAPNPMIC